MFHFYLQVSDTVVEPYNATLSVHQVSTSPTKNLANVLNN